MINRILLKIYRLLQNVILRYKKNVIKKSFVGNCIIGQNFSFNTHSKCINETGNKENIKIGENCEINGL